MNIPALIRAVREDDINFIYSSWLKSHRRSTYAQAMSADVYYDNHKKLLTHLLDRGQILVACNQDDEEQIFGWIVFEPLKETMILHYVYVKDPYRRLGLANRLFTQARDFIHDVGLPVLATHETHKFPHLQESWNLIYNPYVLDKTA